jgi:hypothetical protein
MNHVPWRINRGPESWGPVNVNMQKTPGGYQGGSLNSWQFLEKKSYTRLEVL